MATLIRFVIAEKFLPDGDVMVHTVLYNTLEDVKEVIREDMREEGFSNSEANQHIDKMGFDASPLDGRWIFRWEAGEMEYNVAMVETEI